MSAANFAATLGVRLALMIAMWITYGWWSAVLMFFVLGLVQARTTWFGNIDVGSARTWLRLVVEIVVLVIGLMAAYAVWGQVAVGVLITIYVIGTLLDLAH